MKVRLYVCTLMIVILVFSSGCSKQTEVNKDIETSEVDLKDFFVGYGGSFIIYDEKGGKYRIYNETQADERLSPCSTFKIANSLIGLETNVIKDKDFTYKWDGKKNQVDTWNKDHTLETAIANSVVWYFQRLAQDVGEESMQKYLDQIDYGNNDISGGITQFWLGSSLKISAREQVEFLRNLYHDTLPFSIETMKIVRELIILESTDEYIFSGKTGSADGKLGWFVGTIEKDGNTYYFATNMIGESDVTGSKAKEITIEILKSLKIYIN